jgi:formylmethanofuran dehydrogenase subunit E
MGIPDNYSQWARHDAEQESELHLLPYCSECGEHIQADTCFEINDEIICEECMEHFRKYTVELMR